VRRLTAGRDPTTLRASDLATNLGLQKWKEMVAI